MRKLIKTLACLTLAAALLITAACRGGEGAGNGSDANTTFGRYVETDITPPINGRFLSLVTPDGSLAAFDVGLQTRYDSADGGASWVQSPGPGSNSQRFMGVQTAAFLPDGRLLVFVDGEGMTAVSPDGTSEHFPIDEIDNAIADDENVSVSLIQVLDNNQVLLTYTIGGWDFSGMNFTTIGNDDDDENGDDDDDTPADSGPGTPGGTVTNQTGQVRITTQHVGGRVTMDGGSVVIGGMFGAITAIHDINTGERISELTVPTPLGASGPGDVYFMQGHSLFRYSVGGYIDNVLDGTAFAFGAPANSASTVQSLADGSFIVSVSTFGAEGQINRLYRYSWDAAAAIDPNKTITIWSLEDNALVRAAITEIWRLHPDACITYEIALSGDGAMSASDAIRNLNTRLLSGRGPDILILDGTPIDSYAGRGMLLDLSRYVDTSAMYENLLAPYIDNGRLYVIPTQFSIPVLVGSQQRLNQNQTLAALVESVINGNPPSVTGLEARMLGGVPEEERAELHFNDLNELFEIMWQANATAFIDDNRLDSDVLRQFLSAIKAISDMYDLAAPGPDMMAGWSMVSFGAGGGAGPRINMVPGSMMNYMSQATNMAAFSVDSLTLLQMLDRDDSDLAVFPGLSHGAWRPSTIVGVSADTNVQDFATRFVNTMLSIEVQMMSHGEGLPITREAVQFQIDMINERMAEFNLGSFDRDVHGLVSQLRTPSIIEATLREMIWETVERLCSGRIDLEGAVSEVEQNIRNYLAERS